MTYDFFYFDRTVNKVTMQYWVLPFIFLISFVQTGLAQTEPEQPLDDYEWRVEQDYLMGVYIPEDEEDAFVELKRLAEPEGLAKFKNAAEKDIRRNLHFGLGKWMMQNWQLLDGSRLSHYLKERGLAHSDDMVEYLIVTFHRHLNEKPLQSGELIEEYNEARKKAFLERQKQIPKKVIDTLSE